jgi:hypothetical protein
MAFAPERHYTNGARMSRIYNELYTGDWWWTVQVCFFYSDQTHCLMFIVGTHRCTSTGGYNHPTDCIHRQDTVNTVQRQNGIPDISHDWKHSQGSPPKNVMPCPNTHWVYSNNQANWDGQQSWSPLCPGQPLSLLHVQCTRSDRFLWRKWG